MDNKNSFVASVDKAEKAELIHLLKKNNFAKHRPEAPFTLASGKKSDYYFSIKNAFFVTPLHDIVRRIVVRASSRWSFNYVGGPANAAYSLVAVVMGAPTFYGKGFVVRKETKDHGLKNKIDGEEVTKGSKVLVVEDVITTGGSLLPVLNYIKDSGGEIVQIFAVMDREADGDKEADKLVKYREAGLISSVLKTGDVFPALGGTDA
jgi:orotate phosphoribosyltransferase